MKKLIIAPIIIGAYALGFLTSHLFMKPTIDSLADDYREKDKRVTAILYTLSASTNHEILLNAYYRVSIDYAEDALKLLNNSHSKVN